MFLGVYGSFTWPQPRVVEVQCSKLLSLLQWHNRWGSGGHSAPQDFWPGNFCLRIGEKRGKEKREKGWKGWKLRRKEKENCKREGGKLEMEEGEDLFFFFFFLLFTFENNRNLFWVYQNGNFLAGKSISHREKKSEKMTLPPQKNMPVMPLACYATSLYACSSQCDHTISGSVGRFIAWTQLRE